MKGRDPLFELIFEMEDDVADVRRWADVIRDLGSTGCDVSPDGLFAIGGVLIQLGDRLQASWKAAFAAAGGGR